MINFNYFPSILVLWLVTISVSCGQNVPCDINSKMISPGSQMECLQGVYQIENDNNPDYENYQITNGFRLLVIYLIKESNNSTSLYEFNLAFHGFVQAKKLENICELQSEGPTYVSISEKDIKNDGTVNSYYKNEEFYCEAESVEYFTRKLMFMNKLQFLPFRAYKEIKKQAIELDRDFITEFDILSKLKKAKVKTDRTYFHNKSSANTKRNAFVVKGDVVIIDEIQSGWIKVAYEGEQVTTEGWIKSSDLQMVD
jgi:hypothetical protein